MGFEVRPTGLRPRHTRLGIAAALLIGTAVIGLGFASRTSPARELAAPTTPSAGPVLAGPIARASPAPSVEGAAPSSSPRALPAALVCRDVARAACTKAATAALSILPADLPAVSGATVWRSLLCSVLPDCPPQLLTRDAVPLGSVIVTFADAGPEAWINVVEHHGGLGGKTIQRATAWIVRWH